MQWNPMTTECDEEDEHKAMAMAETTTEKDKQQN